MWIQNANKFDENAATDMLNLFCKGALLEVAQDEWTHRLCFLALQTVPSGCWTILRNCQKSLVAKWSAKGLRSSLEERKNKTHKSQGNKTGNEPLMYKTGEEPLISVMRIWKKVGIVQCGHNVYLCEKNCIAFTHKLQLDLQFKYYLFAFSVERVQRIQLWKRARAAKTWICRLWLLVRFNKWNLRCN